MPRRFEILGRTTPRGPGERLRAREHPERGDPRVVDVVLLDPRWSGDPAIARGVQHDLERLAGLRHPGLAIATDLARLDGRLAVIGPSDPCADLAMIAGVPLSAAVALTARVADALDAVAGLGLAHGHVDPSAITVDPDGGVRLHGAGLTRPELPAWSPETGGLRRAALVPAAPEQLVRARLLPTPAGDVYALGTLLATWWRGIPLGPGRLRPSEHAAAIDARLGRAPDAPEALRALVRAMLAFDPAERPAPRDVREAARAVLDGLDDADEALAGLALDHPDELRPDPDWIGREIVAEPLSAPQVATELRSRRGTFALDPAGTLAPLSDPSQWADVRASSLDAVAVDPLRRPAPARARRLAIGAALLLAIGGFVAIAVAVATTVVWSIIAGR